MRQLTVNLRATLAASSRVLALPVLIGPRRQMERARRDRSAARRQLLAQVENGSYRAATGELTAADPVARKRHQRPRRPRRRSIRRRRARWQKLPAVVKARAAGGSAMPQRRRWPNIATAALTSPEDTFGVLRDLLQGLESRLRYVRRDVERREALAAATPSIWPAHGWLTGTFGGRSDPFTGEPASTRASTSRPKRASRSTRRPTARSNRRPTPATTAT